jgi:hypothetical protein
MRRCNRETILEKLFYTLHLHIMACEVVLLGRDIGTTWCSWMRKANQLSSTGRSNMKRLLILGILVVTAASTCGCRWCGWGREGAACNACSAPGGYPSESYYGGEVYGGDMVEGQYYGGQMTEGGLPIMPVPESLPSPAGAR